MSDIKFQVKASQQLQQYHFKQFVLDMYEVFDTFSCSAGKLAVNGFIGLLGKSKIKRQNIILKLIITLLLMNLSIIKKILKSKEYILTNTTLMMSVIC